MATINTHKVLLATVILLILMLSACGAAATPAVTGLQPEPTFTSEPVEPSDTPLPPTDTPISPTDTPGPTLEPTVPPTSTPTAPARPTTAPGTKFEFSSGGLTFELKAPECNLLEVRYVNVVSEGGRHNFDWRGKLRLIERIFGPDSPVVVPYPSGDFLCWVDGEVKSGTASEELVQSWLDEKSVFLVDPSGAKGRLVFAGLDAAKQDLLMLFSIRRGFVPVQLQMPDILVDLP